MVFKFIWLWIFSDSPLTVVTVDDVGSTPRRGSHFAYSVAEIEFLVSHESILAQFARSLNPLSQNRWWTTHQKHSCTSLEQFSQNIGSTRGPIELRIGGSTMSTEAGAYQILFAACCAETTRRLVGGRTHLGGTSLINSLRRDCPHEGYYPSDNAPTQENIYQDNRGHVSLPCGLLRLVPARSIGRRELEALEDRCFET